MNEVWSMVRARLSYLHHFRPLVSGGHFEVRDILLVYLGRPLCDWHLCPPILTMCPNLILIYISYYIYSIRGVGPLKLLLSGGRAHSPHSPKSSTTHRRFRLQHGYCIGVSRRSALATVGKGLAQGPYVAARAGVEPTTIRLKVIDSTKAPSRLTSLC